MSQWKNICKLDDILPETGVCALLGDKQVAIFRPYHGDQVFAISNIDPFFESSVLSRGLIAEHQGELWVASPLKNSVSACATACVWKMKAIQWRTMKPE